MFIFFVFLILLSPAIVEGADRQPNGYTCESKRISKNLEIDGTLSEEEWKSAPRHTIDFEIQPGENIPAKQRTEFFSLYNDTYLYFGFVCYDSVPSQIRANLSDRDHIYTDDYVGILLDPYHDNQKIYEFLVNPLGVQADLIRTGTNEDDSFDALWYSAGKITEYGYTIEIAIPFKSIRFPSAEKQEWGLITGRIYPRENRYLNFWTPQDRNNPCMGCQGGVLTGIEGIKNPVSVEVLPYVLGFQRSGLYDNEDQNSGFEKGKLHGRAGLGLKIAPTSNNVIEAVINPDFSQVETDAQQISVNQAFSIYYAEKRPFFLEGNEIFNTKLTTFYSRFINNPLYSAKLTGKEGVFSYAVLSASDRNGIFITPGEESSQSTSSDINTYANVMRGRYNFGEESFIGAILTDRFYNGGGNHVGGIDWNYLFNKNCYFSGQFLYAHTKELNNPDLNDDTSKLGHSGYDAAFNGESYNGTALRLEFNKQARSHWIDISYKDVSPAFQSQLGFITQSNVRNVQFETGYTIYSDSSFIKQSNFYVNPGMTFNHNSVTKEHWVYVGTNVQCIGQLNFSLGGLPVNEEIFHGVKFMNIQRANAGISGKPIDAMNFSLYAEIGRFIDREDDPTLGFGHNLGGEINFKPTAKLQCNFKYDRARLSDVVTKELLYDGYIFRFVSSYQFDKESFVRLISEYNSFDKSINFFPLFSYKLNPFTIFYIGTTYNLAEFEDHPSPMNRNRFLQTERQYFIKLQYLWSNL